jgi:uncharacterized protein with ParB-like and HNH nuclease domain
MLFENLLWSTNNLIRKYLTIKAANFLSGKKNEENEENNQIWNEKLSKWGKFLIMRKMIIMKMFTAISSTVKNAFQKWSFMEILIAGWVDNLLEISILIAREIF